MMTTFYLQKPFFTFSEFKNLFAQSERSTWRSGVRSAISAASQLPGRGPTEVDDALHLHVNQKSDYDIFDMQGLTDPFLSS